MNLARSGTCVCNAVGSHGTLTMRARTVLDTCTLLTGERASYVFWIFVLLKPQNIPKEVWCTDDLGAASGTVSAL